jgi:Flp pilus assembly protein TadD
MSQFMTHDYASCIRELKGAGNDVSSIPQMQYIYADSLVKTGQVSQGKGLLEKLEAAHPEIAEVHRALGEAWENEGDCEQAMKEFEAASRINASDFETRYDIDRAELKCGASGTGR